MARKPDDSYALVVVIIGSE
ncbi:uncharacterized protein G2W53_034928 [Senna tora]|uniref:Uncharacterized protein n=1 Tax=Senna tora TaxID=362788 RepID=A0A834SSL0_9FABA|nr:uncharacterized protein G2W53_034928 [Senna tora]